MVLHNPASSVMGGPSGIVMTGELYSLVKDRQKSFRTRPLSRVSPMSSETSPYTLMTRMAFLRAKFPRSS